MRSARESTVLEGEGFDDTGLAGSVLALAAALGEVAFALLRPCTLTAFAAPAGPLTTCVLLLGWVELGVGSSGLPAR